jgi:formylglycine-generating enzyme required for sulfatase activity
MPLSMSSTKRIGPGTVIDGRYELLSHLGTGGFGLVYKARQLATGQLVAVKIARHLEGPSARSAVARFQREMAVVGQLSHPNIVRLIDAGQVPEGPLFTVLELVRGDTLADLLTREGPLDPGEAKHLMIQVLDALFSAHDLGVIHRDLKPANIMVNSVGARRNAMVLDFGIATFIKAMRSADYQSLTPDGFVGGTPAYMAPEQFHGREPNPQTDIYAWGLMFLECLTGHRVVRGSTMAETMFLHLREEPHPLPPLLDAHLLGRILATAIAKEPEQRYADTRDALIALVACDVSDLPRAGLAAPDVVVTATPKADPYGRTPRGAAAQSGIRWLHIADLHAGGQGTAEQHELFDGLRQEIRATAERLGPPDLILLTGDAACTGQDHEYGLVENMIDRIRGWLGEVHPDAPPPLLFAVPGNHDVVWPGRKEKRLYRVLGDYDHADDPDVRDLRDELWRDHDVSLVEPLFAPYLRWHEAQVLAPLDEDERCVRVRASFFPGDFGAVVEKDGFRLGLLGLNSAWVQYGPGDFAGKLHVTREQLQAAWPEDATCERALLLMHHAPGWLSPQAREVLSRELPTAMGVPLALDACLYGHAHAARVEVRPATAAEPRAAFQAASLFGLARAGSDGRTRALGYAWGEIRPDGALRVWPRVLAPTPTGSWAFGRDQRFDDPSEDGAVWLRNPRGVSAQAPAPPVVEAGRTPVVRSAPTAPASPASFDHALADYARWARSAYERIDMAGLGGGHLRLRLDDVFVPLRVRNRSSEAAGGSGDGDAERGQPRPDAIAVELDDAFTHVQPARHLFILGEPGAGKTTALKKLLWSTLAGDGSDAFDGTRIGLPQATVPVLLRLRDLTPAQRRQPMSAFIEAQLAQIGNQIGNQVGNQVGNPPGAKSDAKSDAPDSPAAEAAPTVTLPPGFGQWLWQRGHLLLLLDGLDEIADSGQRAEVCRYIENHLAGARAQDIANIRVVVSSRHAGLYGAASGEVPAIGFGPEFARLDIRPLDDAQIELLITRWFVAAELSMTRLNRGDEEVASRRGRERGMELAVQLRAPEYASRRIKELVSNPLLLTLLCVQVFDGGHIPRQRVDFFHDCLRTLLRRWTRTQGSEAPLVELGDALRLLRPVAWMLHTGERKSDLRQHELRRAMRAELRRLQIDRQVSFEQVLDWLCRQTGVLTEFAPGEFGFLHLSLQEYLAATYAALHVDEGLARLTAMFGQPWWREVILLFVALNEGQYFAPLISRVLATDDVLEREEGLLRACLDEANAPDTSPLIRIISADHERPARRVAALRLVLHRVDDRVRRAAMQAALQAARGTELRALAEEVESRRLPVDDEDALVSTPGIPVNLAENRDLLDVVLVPSSADDLGLDPLVRALAGAGLHAAPVPEDALGPSPLRAAEIARNARSAVALIGPSGAGPWETMHTRALLHAFVDRNLPVVPVLLPGAGRIPDLPRFLSQYTWVDLRAGMSETELARLLWGITGKEPNISTDVFEAMSHMPVEQFFVEPTTGIRFLWIPGGTFRMGANDLHAAARPPHRVQVSPFWMSETLVTNRQYEQFVVSVGYDEPMYWRERRYNEPEQPVVGVRWEDARMFCLWLSEISGYLVDLPTEAQWELAARSEDNRLYPWGNEEPDATRAHFASPGSTPLPVGSLPAGRGPFGTLDQAGNVWEWCRDLWHASAYLTRDQLTEDPFLGEPDGDELRHAVRGGSFLSHPLYLRAAYRDRYRAILSDDLGFRVVALPGSHARSRHQVKKP